MTFAAFVTWNLVFKGVVGGLITGLVAMGIVLVYRSSRVINFAVGNMGVPATALFAVMVGAYGWPYWVSLAIALVIGTLIGALIEVTVIRRLFKAPRVIVLVATIGVAQLCEAVTLALPEYRTGSLQTQFPLPFTGTWHPGLDIEVTASQVLILIVVPLITLGLWWLLGHTAFGDAVRACCDQLRSRAHDGHQPQDGVHRRLGDRRLPRDDGGLPDRHRHGIGRSRAHRARHLAAGHGGGTDRWHGLVPSRHARRHRHRRARSRALLQLHDRDRAGAVRAVPRGVWCSWPSSAGATPRRRAKASSSRRASPRFRNDCAASGGSNELPQFIAGLALLAAVVLPMLSDKSERHQTWTVVVAFALCAVSVVVLTGWGGQLSLGQMAFAGLGALTAAALIRGVSANIGWHDTRIINGSLGGISFLWALLIGASVASLVAVLVGVGALRVRGLLLAISTLAFAIAAQVYLFNRPFFTAGFSTVQIPRVDIGPLELTHKNRAYYYFVLIVLVVVLLLVAHLKRTGIGRMIVGVRENELAAAAMTVSPARAKLIAFAVGGFIAGLGGVLLGAVNLTFGPSERFFLVDDSIRLISIAVIGGLGSLSGAVVGALWVVGLPSFWPQNELVPLFTSSIGLLLILLYIPGGFVQIGYYVRDSLLRLVEKRLGPVEQTKTVTVPPASLQRAAMLEPATRNADGSVLATQHLTVRFGGLIAVNDVDFHAEPGEVIGLIGNNGAGKSTLAERDRWLRAESRLGDAARPGREQEERPPARPGRARPHLPGRPSLSRS